ncbi:MAG: hypothetical protein GY869_19100 [Planctomycetes bacterium]|nr:hypothetical protein [Planctomycetota bacterium]
MENEEKIQFLANVYYLAMVDGQVERLEERLFDYIAKGIQAGYFETLKAMDLAKTADFEVKYPMRLSDRIKCVEDLLLIAYADDKLVEVEKKIVLDYANHVGIHKDQFVTIKDETVKRLKVLKQKLLI